MMTNLLQSTRLPRRAVLAGTAALLAGCAAKPIVIDHAAMASIRRVTVPTVGFPEFPQVQVLNTAADRMGLIGLVAGSIIVSNRKDAVKAMMAARGLDPQAYFQTALAERLRARNLAVLPDAADAARRAFLPKYEFASGQDALLDAYVVSYGFVALNDMDRSPFRPTVVVSARLVNARDRSVLMQDTVQISGIEGVKLPGASDPAQANFKDFAELEANPDRAMAGLRTALIAAAEGVGQRLA